MVTNTSEARTSWAAGPALFSPTLINDVRIGYQRDFLDLDCQGCPRQPGLLASFGIQQLQAPTKQLEEYPSFGFI